MLRARECKCEDGALANRAHRARIAVHGARKIAADGQPEGGTVEVVAEVARQLNKWLEVDFHLCIRYPDSVHHAIGPGGAGNVGGCVGTGLGA